MIKHCKFVLICCSILLFSLSTSAQKKSFVLIATTLGDIQVELYPDKAPITVANFLKYVENNLYTNSSFFRVCTPENEVDSVIKIEVIQGGDIPDEKLLLPIAIETTQQTGIQHENGTISMARGAPNSAQSSFFICINDQPELDFNGKRNPDGQGFAAFGKVTKGMEVVLNIQSGENNDQTLSKRVSIKSIRMLNQ